MSPISMRWEPIADLPEGYETLGSSELKALAEVWMEQHQLLSDSDGLRTFNERLQRKWAIETGIIERIYTLNRGVTQLLIEHGVDASLIPSEATDKDPHLVATMIRDHEAVVEGLFAFIRGHRDLTTGYSKELHAALTRSQESTAAIDTLGRLADVPLVHGAYKDWPNNPTRENGSIHEYCPPEHVAAEMDRLVALHAAHEGHGVSPEIEAAWLHHRFAQIHPFQDGNGRVARALASLVFIKAGWFPLVVDRDDRIRYIDSLEAADAGELRPLIDFFASVEKRAFVGALSEAGAVLQQRQVDHVIEAARDLFARRQETLRHEWEYALDIARLLQSDAHHRFDAIAGQLRAEIMPLYPEYRFRVDTERFGEARDHFFRWQIVQTAHELGYFANTSPGYRAWSRIILTTDTPAEILLSFHGIGRDFRGVLGASMCFFRREDTEDGEREIADLVTVVDEVFQINYREDAQEIRGRFDRWLEAGLVRGLEVWRSGL